MKIRIKFKKYGSMKFIGHLDVMRYFQKVMRRAGVDICYSGGFSPHQVMSFASPLGVGVTSEGEYVDIEVHSSESSSVMVKRLNAVMTEGFEAVSWRLLPDEAKTAMSQWRQRIIRFPSALAMSRRGRAPVNFTGGRPLSLMPPRCLQKSRQRRARSRWI